MWLILLSVLTTNSVLSASVGYPYRSIWTYNPLQSGSIHGYLRYLENNGAGSLVGYNQAQPIYAVRQIKYANDAAPGLEAAISNSEEVSKARETYFRAASLQQYQNLKNDIEVMRAQGKEPSAEKLLKLQMLEKIAFSSDFSLIADLPEVKSTLQDLEADIGSLPRKSAQPSSPQQANAAQNQGEIKTYVGNSNIPPVAIEETPEQKQARENHLRIYNEQIAHLKQLESEHQKYVLKASSQLNTQQSPKESGQVAEQTDNAKALAQLELAQQEHFRLWKEAKERAEQAGYENGEKRAHDAANKEQISLQTDQAINSPKQTTPKTENAATQKVQVEQQSFKSASTIAENNQQISSQAELKKEQVQNLYHKPEQKRVIDTPAVELAGTERLRIVNEVASRGSGVSEVEAKQQHKHSIKSDFKEGNAKTPSAESLGLKGSLAVVEETPEVKKAREEHLRLVQEANLRAQFVEQQELKYKHDSQTPILKSPYEHQQQVSYSQKPNSGYPDVSGSLRINEESEKRIVGSTQLQPQQPSETSEIQRAREEHLRVFNAIKSHAIEEHAKQNSHIVPHPVSSEKAIVDYSMEEERLLELERLREAERFQKEQQLLELDRIRESERLAEEKRQMEAELTRLRLEQEQRLEMERLMEEKRLQQEQEDLRKLQSGQYQEIIIQADAHEQRPLTPILSNSFVELPRGQQSSAAGQQQTKHYADNQFLKDGQVSHEPPTPVKQSIGQESSLLKTVPEIVSSNAYQHNLYPHHSSGGKHQYIKYNYHNSASGQPADTAVALIALEKATNDHFRAHELALEQLRLARIQNPVIKDCN